MTLSIPIFALLALPAADPADSTLEEITITVTKAPRPLLEVPATVSVVTAEKIDRQLVTDIESLVRYEPGVSVRNSLSRFGLTDFNIRGIDGNRVLLEVDNVRLPDAFSFGSFSFATRDGVEVDLLKRVEIVRGSASSLYGSNALGGVVAFTTKDPDDLLRPDQDFGGSVKAGYTEEDDGYGGTAVFAGRAAAWSGLVAYTHRDAGTPENQGTNESASNLRTAPNPQESYSDSFLVKALWTPGDRQTLRLTGERSRTDVFTDVLSSRTSSPALRVTQLLGNDEELRTRVALDQEFRDLGWTLLDGGEWRIYSQESETTQYTSEERVVIAGPVSSQRRRERIFAFTQDALGAELTLRKALSGNTVDQLITYGVEYLETDIEQSRDGFELNRTTGLVSNTVGADVFPVRDTPKATTRQTSAYLQDEIEVGSLTFTPSLRVDRYELNPEPDAIFAADNPGIVPVSLTDTSLSPRLGVVWRATEAMAVFGSYSGGFRAPPFGDVNVGFTNPIGRYTTIPNPDLEPETSDNFEAGLRVADGEAFLSTSIYYNSYEDFIESFSLVGTQPGTGFLVFQSRNLGEVSIYGIELKGAYPITDRIPGLLAKTAISYGVGDNEANDEPLNTIDPPQGVFALEYRPRGRRWGAEFVATVVDRKRDIDETAGPLFASPGYTTFDLLADLTLWEGAKLHVGAFNLGDKKYWAWSDVRGRPASDPAIDFFTRPGRTLAANLKFTW